MDTTMPPPECPLEGGPWALDKATAAKGRFSMSPGQGDPRWTQQRPQTKELPKARCSTFPRPNTSHPHNHHLPSLAECPAIVPRCMWGARPYRGTPRPLSPPLGSIYIHHTFVPSAPCRSFTACARDMRSMQRFHQDTRGWDDIGYR